MRFVLHMHLLKLQKDCQQMNRLMNLKELSTATPFLLKRLKNRKEQGTIHHLNNLQMQLSCYLSPQKCFGIIEPHQSNDRYTFRKLIILPSII